MSNKKKYEGEKEMAESRKMKTEKGLALVPGANPLADGCNFAVEVPESISDSLQKEISKTLCGDSFYRRKQNRKCICNVYSGF